MDIKAAISPPASTRFELLKIDGRVVDLQPVPGRFAAVVVEAPEEHQPQRPPQLGPRRQELAIGGEHLLDLDQHVTGGGLAKCAVQGEPPALVKPVAHAALVALLQPHGVHLGGLDLHAVDELLDLPAELLLVGRGQHRDPRDGRPLDRPDHQAGGLSPRLPDLDPIDPGAVLRLDQPVQRAAGRRRAVVAAAQLDGFGSPITRVRAGRGKPRPGLDCDPDEQNRPVPAKSGHRTANVVHHPAC